MKFNNPLKQTDNNDNSEYLLVVEITQSLVKTALLTFIHTNTSSEGEAKINIEKIGSFEAYSDDDSLINGIDASLTQATKNIDPPPIKVIFGLPETWLNGTKISPKKTPTIKKIIKELGLEPVGLVTSTEAIIHELKKGEGIPPSSILLEIYPQSVIISLVILGEIQKKEEVARSDNLTSDVEEGLTRMGEDRLPARFIIIGGVNPDTEKEQLLSHSWQENLSFLHIPKVETLPSDFSVRAIALSAGPEVIKVLYSNHHTTQSNPLLDLPADDDSQELFGFSVEKDISNDTSDSLDSDNTKLKDESQQPQTTQTTSPFVPDEIPHEETPSIVTKKFLPLKIKFPRPSLPKFKFSFLGLFSSSKKIYLTLASIIILLLITFTYVYLFLSKAEVEINFVPVSVSESTPVIFGQSPTNTTSISAKFDKVEITQEKQISTSGEISTGNKATGKLTIYNKTSKTITLPANTKLESDTGLVFKMNTSISVASASAETSPPFTTTPGSNSVTITASRFGAEYNLSKLEQFSVGNYSRGDVIAVADNDLSGGSSRRVRSVSKKDMEELESDLLQEVTSKIESVLSSLGSDSDKVTLGISDPKITKKDFSASVNEEANSLSLKITATTPTLTYSHTDLVNMVSDKIISTTHPNMRLLPEKTQVKLTNLGDLKDNNKLEATANLTGVIITNTDPSIYRSQITTKPINAVADIFKDLPNYTGTTIIISPNIPILNRFLPPKPKNIFISLKIK